MEPYQQPVSAVCAAQQSSERGLTTVQVRQRTAQFGQNTFPIRKPVSFSRLLLLQFRNFITWLLIAIALFALSTGLLLHMREQLVNAAIVGFIVVVNAFVGAYQDYKAERVAELLRALLDTHATVLRDGKQVVLSSVELVPGDVVALSEGDRIPADCRLLTVAQLRINESMLTGESSDVQKSTKPIGKEVSLAERNNMVYMNTFVTAGSATALVVQTGSRTEVGKIALQLDQEKPSPFIVEVDDAARTITVVALVLIVLVSLFLLVRGAHWVQIFMIASALVVGSIPEGLPAIVTFALAATTAGLAAKQVLVKRKSLLETLGSIDILCTDKTGTLTQNRMQVTEFYLDGKSHPPTKACECLPWQELHRAALLANEAKATEKGFVGVAEDIALIDASNAVGTDIFAYRAQYKIVQLEPFSSETKYSAATVRVGKKLVRYRKGAPELLVAGCSHELVGRKRVKITPKRRAVILQAVQDAEDRALRVIAFVSGPQKTGKKPQDTFLGFAAMHDPPNDGIQEVISSLYGAGIAVKMITGDTIRTAVAIAAECGFRDIKAISWDELKDLSEQELRDVAQSHTVFGRMSPEYKLRIVHALQASGKRVAITGDGVNDAPALSVAEVGVAMGRGADVAKEAGDIVLLDNKLEHVVEAVSAGRTVFRNVRKVLNYLLTTNVAEVFVVFIAAIMGAIPFTAIQLLWVNFVTDVAPAMGLGVDPASTDVMKRKPTGVSERLIDKRLVWLTVLVSITKVLLLLSVYFWTKRLTGDVVLAQTMTFTWLVLTHIVRLVALRFDERMPLLANPLVVWAALVPIALQLLILYTPLAHVFGVVPIGVTAWLALGGLILLSAALARIITFALHLVLPYGQD